MAGMEGPSLPSLRVGRVAGGGMVTGCRGDDGQVLVGGGDVVERCECWCLREENKKCNDVTKLQLQIGEQASHEQYLSSRVFYLYVCLTDEPGPVSGSRQSLPQHQKSTGIAEPAIVLTTAAGYAKP